MHTMMQIRTFNPRSPHRERQFFKIPRQIEPILSIHAPLTGSDKGKGCRQFEIFFFQSTLPSQGATASLFFSDGSVNFQSTLPSQGATIKLIFHKHFRHFQSTLPSQGATEQGTDFSWVRWLSIHAPLTGSDRGGVPVYIVDDTLSIHAPLTGSDDLPEGIASVLDLSIHAPLTGSDHTAYI